MARCVLLKGLREDVAVCEAHDGSQLFDFCETVQRFVDVGLVGCGDCEEVLGKAALEDRKFVVCVFQLLVRRGHHVGEKLRDFCYGIVVGADPIFSFFLHGFFF